MKPEKIILVYNADDGLMNAIFDWCHKFLFPETYQCPLCKFTVSLIGMRLPWKQFLESLGCETVFLHRLQFRLQYPQISICIPTILALIDTRLVQLVSAEEIEGVGNLAGLIQLTRGRWAVLNREGLDQLSQRVLQHG